MESPQLSSPIPPSLSAPSSRSRSTTKLDDITSLTSFNPFSEEDENDQSSYTLVTSIFSRVKNTLAAPLSSAVAAASGTATNPNGPTSPFNNEQRRPSYTNIQAMQASFSSRTSSEAPRSLAVNLSNPAPPLVSLTPVVSEAPTFNADYDRSPSRSGSFYASFYDSQDGGLFGGNAIPGFPIQDDARSIRTSASATLNKTASVSKVIRRIRGEGLSRDYWMDDENCRECYDCKSVFTTWRRKHHCRICGQIFCSRCASNVIKGSRFGQDGMLRVCNLCLEKLAKVDSDDEDDHRSVMSSVSPFPAHQMGTDSLYSFGHHPQSPFAASQLFGRTDEPFNLYSIAETKRPMSDDASGFGSRPLSPGDITQSEAQWDSVPDNPAPFRRALSDEEKDSANLPNNFHNDESPTAPGSKTPIDFPVTIPLGAEGQMSSIQFPMSSPERGLDSPRPGSRHRSRFDSYGDLDAPTPFIRSRVQSRLDNIATGEPGWRTRRESTAYAQELNMTSMRHLKIMLRQMLTTEQIPNVKQWEETLLGLALRIARELTFTTLPHRQGEDMDVRRYVKIKKIPGGSPSDSEYVHGAVITKNVAHKQMSRAQSNPRVMLVTFPLEFYRVEGQYMHFGQIVRQEKEYLGNLASRIAALRPHVVLVEKSVSRLALDALAQHNIAVARAVKPSAIQCVARMTQGDVFSSIDKLALEPRLGHCAKYRIQTYDHPLIPGRRKTYMRFEGCSRDMGCTIILRGGDIDTLNRIKKVTRFLTFIVRNLKLETHLWKDSVISLPTFHARAIPPRGVSKERDQPTTPSGLPMVMHGLPSTFSGSISSLRLMPPSMELFPDAEEQTTPIHNVVIDDDLPIEDVEQLRLSQRIQQSLEPYTKTFISVSATLRFPPPLPILRMKELDDDLTEAKRAWEDEVVRREEKIQHRQDITITGPPQNQNGANEEIPQNHEDISALIEALPTSDMRRTPTSRAASFPSAFSDGSDYFEHSASTTTSNSTSVLGLPGIPPSPLPSTVLEEHPLSTKTTEDIAMESKLSLIHQQHGEQRRIWEWYLRKNQDDFVVEKYQCISLWEYTIPTAEFGLHRACFAPQLKYITFYGENDCTLGQYIEKSVGDTLVQFLDPKAICAGKGCDQSLSRHCRVYVHNETRLFVAVEQWDGQIIGRGNYSPSPDLITTWSACRVCGSATPFIPVSEEMQRYSFAKFLELHFYPADVMLVQGAGCQHNIYKHHVRFFASKGMTVRFQADPIVLHEVIYPPMRIRVRPESQLELKNADFERLHRRNVMWYSALIDDLKLTSIDAATGDEEADAKLTAEINSLIARAEREKNDIACLINKIYSESAPTDTLALNQVRSQRQDRIVGWQLDFDKLPKPRPAPIMGKIRRPSAFGSVRAMFPRRYGPFDYQHISSSSLSEAEEVLSTLRRVTGDSLSSASEASEPETGVIARITETPAPQSETEPSPTTEEACTTSTDPPLSSKSDPDSDSTIGNARDEAVSPSHVPFSPLPHEQLDGDAVAPRASRLPRRTTHNSSVADLVKKYQDFLPPQGVHELTKTAFPPRLPISESDQEYSAPAIPRNAQRRSRHHHASKKSGTVTSDFESSYAANIAPRYLTHSRRSKGLSTSRIPGPILSSTESHESSRRASPDKRTVSGRTEPGSKLGRLSPVPGLRANSMAMPNKGGRAKHRPSNAGKEKITTRPNLPTANKSYRRPTGPGSKVSNIAKHFERMNRDNERASRRYSVIRGRRARPVATARAKVEVLDSVKDVVKDDESESADSSSEADDEGDGNDEGHTTLEEPTPENSSPNTSSAHPQATVGPAPDGQIASLSGVENDAVAVEMTHSEGRPSIGTSERNSDVPISMPPSPFLNSVQSPSHTPPNDIDIESAGTQSNSLLKALGLWLNQPPPSHRTETDTDDPMVDPEHIFRDSSMVVRTDEPTSIIALALNSPQYRDMLARSRAEKRIAKEPKLANSSEAFMPDDRSVAESTSTWGVVNVETAEFVDPTEELRTPSSRQPWAISFESGGLTISCTVLYPEQFDALRRTYDCEKSMIESLARCIKWDARGGKSGSAFLKTRDDRFIAKEISRTELQTMETFAPSYFDYMSSALTANRPTLLAKVFGCYKLTFKKAHKDKASGKSKSTQMNLLVMENLFYDRRFLRIYDLKGSTRNRHVQSTGRENEVLLDENLVETAHLNPFYLREHSKRILRGALYNDSKFLADISVMDYSLVVGFDSQRNELVVGIVDYIRTYTWDKKLESWVKESAFLGGAGKGEPTIVTPKQYRQRFVSAMERYFPLVPDRWMKQKDTPEEDSNCLSELWPDW